jgi:hypothetical protein
MNIKLRAQIRALKLNARTLTYVTFGLVWDYKMYGYCNFLIEAISTETGSM